MALSPVTSSLAHGRNKLSIPKLFALIIGIDEYSDNNIRNLSGAAYITVLRNKQATGEAIVNAIQGLGEDYRINRPDPILLFYAGHGAQTKTPMDLMEVWSPHISMLIPHDFAPTNSQSRAGQGVLDITLSHCLAEIADKKGDNITVILDSCHSGSGTRKHTYAVRGIELPKDYTIHPGVVDASRASASQMQSKIPGLHTHVLLSACKEGETAKERCGRGAFTSVLLDTLRAVGTDKISYRDLITRLPDFAAEQNPQCEGSNQSRVLFNSKVRSQGRTLHRVQMVSNIGIYTVMAGDAYGITEGAEFDVYGSEIWAEGERPLGTIKVSKCLVYTSEAIIAGGSKPFELSGQAFAFQTRVGVREDLRLYYAPPNPKLDDIKKQIQDLVQKMGIVSRSVVFVQDQMTPRDLDMDLVEDRITFRIGDRTCLNEGLKNMPYSIPLDIHRICHVIHRAADFYWYLHRSSRRNAFVHKVHFQCTKLKEVHRYHGSKLQLTLVPEGENLIKGGIMTIEADEKTPYGFAVVNNSDIPLFVSVFYFDVSDLSIAPYYLPPTAKQGAVDPPLPAHGTLSIGFGPGGAQAQTYGLRPGQDVDVGYIKVFLTTEYIDYSVLEQDSPFDEHDRADAPYKNRKPLVWEARLVAVVQRLFESGSLPCTE